MTSALRSTERALLIAIPTFRRPTALARLLESIMCQTIAGIDASVEVVVLDNDAAMSANAIVSSYFGRFPFPLAYERVPERGLSSVRNHALRYARSRFTHLAMIDDDEVADAHWLVELVRTLEERSADVVIGNVPRRLPAGAPRWFARGGFLQEPLYDDGAVLDDGATSSCLLALAAPALAGLEFDRALDLAGGEDQLFFRQVHQRGGRIVFSARSIAWEDVTPQRLRTRYLLARELRRGNSLWYCDARIYGTPVALAYRLAKGAARTVLGMLLLVPRSLVLGRAGCVRSLCDIARGIGMLLGAFRIRVQGYR